MPSLKNSAFICEQEPWKNWELAPFEILPIILLVEKAMVEDAGLGIPSNHVKNAVFYNDSLIHPSPTLTRTDFGHLTNTCNSQIYTTVIFFRDAVPQIISEEAQEIPFYFISQRYGKLTYMKPAYLYI